MKVTNVEKKEKSTVELTIHVEAAEFEAAVQKAYLKNRSRIAVPGFRKGKAPRKIIESMYGTGVFYEDAVNEVYPGGVQYWVTAEHNQWTLSYSDHSAGFGELRQSLVAYDYAGAQVTLTRRDTSEDFDCTSSVTYTMASPDNEIQLWSSLTDADNSSYDYIVICESGPQLPEGRFSAYHGDGTPYPEFDLSQYRR